MEAGLITEKYFENDEKRERVRLFTYENRTFMATWDGKLIPHECAKCVMNRIFSNHSDDDDNLK